MDDEDKIPDYVWKIVVVVALLAGFAWIYSQLAAQKKAPENIQRGTGPGTFRETLRGVDRHRQLMRWFDKQQH
jgi:hypothetical protein